MARITVEDCLKNINNRFILIHMANQRTRQLLKGSKPLVNAPNNREIVKALREIANEKVFLGEEIVERLKEADLMDIEED